jgi:hypothetical protein
VHPRLLIEPRERKKEEHQRHQREDQQGKRGACAQRERPGSPHKPLPNSPAPGTMRLSFRHHSAISAFCRQAIEMPVCKRAGGGGTTLCNRSFVSTLESRYTEKAAPRQMSLCSGSRKGCMWTLPP